MRLLILLAVLAIGIGAYFTLRDNGLFDQVTKARVEQVLLDNGVPENMAGCMAPRMVDELTIEQLRALENLAPRAGETRIPRSTEAALERLRRVEDEKAVRVLAQTGTSCGIEIVRERIEAEFERQRGLQ